MDTSLHCSYWSAVILWANHSLGAALGACVPMGPCPGDSYSQLGSLQRITPCQAQRMLLLVCPYKPAFPRESDSSNASHLGAIAYMC